MRTFSLAVLALAGSVLAACTIEMPPIDIGDSPDAGKPARDAGGGTKPNVPPSSGGGGEAPAADGGTVTPPPSSTPPDPPPPGQPTTSKAGYLHTSGARILDSANREVRLTGLSWFGMETANYAPHGLWSNSMASMLDVIKTLGYNSVRVPFSTQMLDAGIAPNGIDFAKNADLKDLPPIGILDKLVEGAEKRGLKVILDRHRPDSGSQSELWYTSQYSEERWISDWRMLAKRYKGRATVIGADLHNEPHGPASWGDDNRATDWRLAAERAGNAILEENPDWLIIVEGVEKTGGTSSWWGGNLSAAASAPVRLKVAGRLVYSPHDYPSTVFEQTWFKAADYPNNLPGVWDKYWGHLVKNNVAPVWVGEFGTKLESQSDKQWLGALASYIGQNKLSFAFWCLNPNSGDTGGILKDDWQTVNQEKQAILKPILAPFIQ